MVHELELFDVLLEVGVVELDNVDDELVSFCTLDCGLKQNMEFQ